MNEIFAASEKVNETITKVTEAAKLREGTF